MPTVIIEMIEGRTVDQKRALVDGVTKAVVQAVQCPVDAVTVIIHDDKRENYGHGGVLYLDKK